MGPWGHRRVGWGSSQPPKGSRSPRFLPFPGLSWGPAPGTGSLPTLFSGQAPAQLLPALSLGRACPILPLHPCITELGGRAPLFQGPPGGSPGSRDCVGLGREARQGCRGGTSSPGEPKTGSCLTPGATPVPIHPAPPPRAACCCSFFPLPCSELHAPTPAPPRQPGRSRDGES